MPVPTTPSRPYLDMARTLVSTIDPTVYAYPANVREQLNDFIEVSQEVRAAIEPILYRHLQVNKREDIDHLLRLRPQVLAAAESLAILPNHLAGGEHTYCIRDLRPLITRLAPTLKRLLVLHYAANFHPNEPPCDDWGAELSRLTVLEELVVPAYSNIFRHSVAEFAPGRPPGLPVPAMCAAPPPGGPQDTEVVLRDYPLFPYLPNLRRLALSGGRLQWEHWVFANYFPRIEQVVFADPGFIEDSEAQMASIARQLRANPSMRVTVVEEDTDDVDEDWREDLRLLPPGQFFLYLYPEEIVQDGGWLLKQAMEGGLFRVGMPLGA